MVRNIVSCWEVKQKDVPFIQLSRPSSVLELVRVQAKVLVYLRGVIPCFGNIPIVIMKPMPYVPWIPPTIWISARVQNLGDIVGTIPVRIIIIVRIMWFSAIVACPRVSIRLSSTAIIIAN